MDRFLSHLSLGWTSAKKKPFFFSYKYTFTRKRTCLDPEDYSGKLVGDLSKSPLKPRLLQLEDDSSLKQIPPVVDFSRACFPHYGPSEKVSTLTNQFISKENRASVENIFL